MKSICAIVLFAFIAAANAQIPNWEKIPLYARVQLCLQDGGDVKHKIECVAANLGNDLVAAKDKVESLLLTASQEVKEFFKKEGEKVKEVIENRDTYFQQAKGKVNELKEKAKNWFDEHFGGKKTKRDVDAQTKANYEAVLKELEEYFTAKEQGKTLHEFLESKKHHNKRQVGTVASNWEKIPLHTRVQLCLQDGGDLKHRIECVATNLGNDLVAAKDKVEALLVTASQEIKDFFKKEGEKVKEVIENRDTYFQQAKGKVNELKEKAKNWFDEHFGGKKTKRSVDADVAAKYEAVLKELEEYFKAKQEGKTLHEFLESKKHHNKRQVDATTAAKYDQVLKELQEYFKAKEQGKTLDEWSIKTPQWA